MKNQNQRDKEVVVDHYHVCLTCKIEYAGYDAHCKDEKEIECGGCLGKRFPGVTRTVKAVLL